MGHVEPNRAATHDDDFEGHGGSKRDEVMNMNCRWSNTKVALAYLMGVSRLIARLLPIMSQRRQHVPSPETAVLTGLRSRPFGGGERQMINTTGGTG